MHQSIPQTPSHVKTFVACLLSFMLFIAPITALAATTGSRATVPSKTRDAKTAESKLFVNGPATADPEFAPQPAPAPEPFAPAPIVGTITATMAAVIGNDDGDNKIDPTNGNPATTEKINYTVQLSNTSGVGAAGLAFNVPLDSHTTIVGGSLNSTPVAFDQSVNTNEDTGVAITLTGQDPDGSNLTFTNISSPTNGTLGVFSAPSCNPAGVCSSTATYTPNANFFGADSFNFKVNDGTAASNQTGVVSITVTGVNDAPTFTQSLGNQSVNEDAGAQSVSSFITAVSPGPANESAQVVDFVVSNNNNSLFSTQPFFNVSGTTATLNYTPAANQNGVATVSYHAHDDGGTANGGVNASSPDLTFTITVNAVNDPPVVVSPTSVTPFAIQANMKRTGFTGLLANVQDNADNGVNGCVSNTFTVTAGSISATSPAGGTVSNLNTTTGTFDFDPPPGVTGTVTFTYTVSDTGCGLGTPAVSSPVTVTFNVAGPVIWFVNPTAANPAAAGDGRLSSPFTRLDQATTAMGINANQRIFVFKGFGSTVSGTGVTLTTSQWLIGQGAIDASNNFDTLMGITPPANTIARPGISNDAASSTTNRPNILGRVQMNASNTRVRGININPPAGTQALTGTSGAAMTGMQVGVSASQSDVTITATGINGTNAMGVSLFNAGGVFSLISVNVNKDGSNNQPNKGISLLTTTGSFTVLGIGTTAGSGGTIQNITARGAEFVSATNITLKNMNFTNAPTADFPAAPTGLSLGNNTADNASVHLQSVSTVIFDNININGSQEQGINGHNVNGFSLTNSTLTNVGNGADEDGMHFYNMVGTCAITNTTFTSSGDDNINIQNSNLQAGDLPQTTTSNITFTGGSANTGVLGSGYLMGIRGTMNTTVLITGVTANNNFSGGIVIDTFDTATSKIEITGVTSTNNNDAISLSSNNGSTKFDIHDNVSFAGTDHGVINILKAAFSTGGTLQGKIRTNPIAVSDGQVGDGISVFQAGAGALIVAITNNTITYRGTQRALLLQGGQDSGPGPTGVAATFDVTVTGNNIDMQVDGTGNPVTGMLAQVAVASPSGDNMTMCADIGGAGALKNTFTHTISAANMPAGDLRVRQRFVTTVKLPGYGGANNDNAAVVSYLAARNTLVNSPTATATNEVGVTAGAQGFVNTAGSGPCSQPNVAMLAPVRTSEPTYARTINRFENNKRNSALAFLEISSNIDPIVQSLNNLEPAPALLSNTGLASQIVAGVKGGMKETEIKSQRLDISQKSEIRTQRSEVREQTANSKHQVALYARAAAPSISENNRGEVKLNHARSVRRKQANATMAPVFAPMPSPPPGTFPINGTGSGFSLPNGKTITITFSVTLNNPPLLTGSPKQVSAQGVLTGAGAPIFTDDPNTGTAGDATITPADLPDTATAVSSSQNPSFVGQNVKFTATVSSTGGVPTGSVQFKDGASNLGAAIALATGGTCPAGSACATTPDISSLTSGTHVITAEYTNSDGNFDDSIGTLAGGQVVNNKTNTTTTVLSSLNPSNVGDGVTFTAQVNSASATGTVQFWDGPSGTGVALGGPVTLTTGGSCPGGNACASTAAITTLTAGTHTITADYSGDVGFNSSTATLAGGQVVNKKATTTVVSSSPNPSNIGESVALTATVSGTGSTPTGTVQFKDGGVDVSTPQTLNGSGVATLNTSFSSPGAHSITAFYSGDGTFLASDNTATPYTHNVNTCTATEVVGNTNDAGAGSLRDAIANVCVGGTITFDPAVFTTAGSPHVINLADANGELLIAKNLTITGPGAGIVTVQRDGAAINDFRVFRISNSTTTGPTVNISGLTVSNGREIDGGGIYNDHGTLTVTNVIVSGNTAVSGNGGGIYNDGRTSGAAVLNVNDSTLSGNTALTGGALYNDGLGGNATATINGSTLNGNTAADGGAIHNEADATFSATLNINNSTISGNFANNNGGGLHNFGPTAVATLTSITITGNHADNDDSAAGSGGGINVASGTVTLKNTIVAGNLKGAATPTPDDIAGLLNAAANANTFNLIGDAATAGGLVDATDNNIVGDTGGTGTRPIATILNTTLADNGGPTKTHALANNSPALEKGSAFALTTDQRGFPRPVNSDAGVTGAGDESDIGAFEAQLAPGAPGTPNLDAVSDSGANSTDDKTNVTTNLSFTIPGVTAGASVELFRDGVSVASGLAAGTTIQLVDPGPLTFDADGTDYVYTAKQSLGAGNTSVASSGLTVNVNIIPDAPVLDPASDSGTLGDGITNDTSPTFNITNVVNGATIKLLRDGTQVASGTAAGTTIQLTDPSAPNGTFTYTATQELSAVTSNPSAGTSVTITIQPNAPDLDAGSDTGTSTTDNYTADSTPTFNLTGIIVGANVELLRDGTSVANNASAGSTTIQLTDPGAADGLHTYKVRQTVGVTLSPDSAGLDVTIDTLNNAPSTPDLDTASDSNITTDNYTNDNTPTFSGTAEANSTVRLFANAVLKGTTTADNAGAWSITSTTLADNSYSITADSTDIAGNPSSASGALNPVVIDTALPSVNMTSGASNPTATTPIPVTVTFNEAVTGFTIGDIVGTNGTAGNFAGGPIVYTFDLTPAGPGSVSADIAGGVAIDLAGNANTAALQFNRTFDPSALSASITAVSPDPRNTSVSTIQIVFNKAVTGFDLSDLTLKLNGGANLLTGAQTLTSGDNITWTLGNLSGITTAEGTYVLLLTASGSNIKDSALNPLTGDASDTWVMDTTAPTVAVTIPGSQANPATGPSGTTVINFTVTFSESVTGFTAADVVLSGTANPTIANVTGSGTTYNVAVQGMNSSGAVTITIPAAAANDAAGNGNTSVGPSNTATVTFNKDDFTTLEVNSTADTDDGPCSAIGTGNGCTLREAINAANGDTGAETITFNSTVFAAPGPYTINLTGALPDLASDMTISGPGAKVLTVKRNTGGNYRVFTIPAGNNNVTIDGLTINNGAPAGDGGGILISSNGTVNVTNSTISGNTATGLGGGVLNNGSGILNVTGSTISGNTSGTGGGIYNNGAGASTVTNSTISGNTATADGGGIANANLILTITNSTITNNRADNDNNGSGTGGGIFRSAGTVTLKNTIVAGNFNDASPSTTADDISGTVNAASSFNLIGTGGAGGLVNGTNSNQVGVADPGLNALLDNGGPTFTHAVKCTSVAIDKGNNFGVPTDQRGGTRPFDLSDSVYPNATGGDGSDIGAYETQSGGGCLPLAIAPATQVTDEDTPVTITLTATFSQNSPLTFSISQAPAHGTTGAPSAAVCNFTTFTTCTSTVLYTPSTNYNGPDSFKFIASAGPGLDSDPADVNVTVNAVNDAPVALLETYSTPENNPLTVPALTGVLANDSDVDSVSLTAVLSTGPAHAASFALNPDGSFNYTPVAGFSGTDSFKYRASDGSLTSNLATVTINVNDGGAIHFTSLTYTVTEDGSDALFDVVRTGGSAGTATVVFAATDGTATLADGDYTQVTQTLTFLDGETSKTVHVPITEDFRNEPDETLNVTLGPVGGSGELVAPNAAVLTIVNDDPTGGYIRFSSATYTVAENGGGINITVNRVGTSNLPVTVEYATSDMTASERMDYTTALGTLSFAAGETTKTFTVLVNQDAFAEGSELLGLTLANVTGGAVLGVPQNATLQIDDSGWTSPPANPIDDSEFFVRQHYHDFLNREPEAAGLAFWVDNINKCNDPARRLPGLTTEQCIEVQRINTSAAFFLSIEFQETGFTAYLANKEAFGAPLPLYHDFVRDTQALGRGFVFGAPGSAAVLEANKVAFFNDFVSRPGFLAIYGALSNAQYVDALIANTGVPFTPAERDGLVNGLNGATETRATVLRKISEKASFRQAETNRAFVMMEYFGYLRRDPDMPGFNFWFNKLNLFNGNFEQAEMVKAFILSIEYHQRFAP